MLTDDLLMGIKKEDPGAPRQVKLRLPLEQVMKLHRLRILKGQPISAFVAEALDAYFDEQRALRLVEVRSRKP